MSIYRLYVLNLYRWIKEYWISWGILGTIYSIALGLVIQPILEKIFSKSVDLLTVIAINFILLLVPALLEHIRFPETKIFLNTKKFSLMTLYRLYGVHELRRINTWLGIAIAVAVGAIAVEPGKEALWILISFLTVQRALYSFQKWRNLSSLFYPKRGAQQLLGAFMISQMVQGFFCGGIWWILFSRTSSGLLAVFAGIIGGLAASSVAFEGDSGRPWLVNLFSMGVGTVAGILTFLFPSTTLFVIYLAYKMTIEVKDRIHSVERMDEDLILS